MRLVFLRILSLYLGLSQPFEIIINIPASTIADALPYLQNDLESSCLAESVNINPHNLSQYLSDFKVCLVIPLFFVKSIDATPVASACSLHVFGHSAGAYSEHWRIRVIDELIFSQQRV